MTIFDNRHQAKVAVVFYFIGKFDFSRGKEKDIRSSNVCQAW